MAKAGRLWDGGGQQAPPDVRPSRVEVWCCCACREPSAPHVDVGSARGSNDKPTASSAPFVISWARDMFCRPRAPPAECPGSSPPMRYRAELVSSYMELSPGPVSCR
jgi:hypothetical protein